MTDRDKLPAKATTTQAVLPSEYSGTPATRGPEAFRNKNNQALSLSTEAHIKKLFRGACERGEYETALQIIQSLANRGSALAEELCDDLCMEAVASDVFFGDDDDEHDLEVARREVASGRVVSCLRKAAEQGDALAQDMLGSLYCHGSWATEGDPADNAEAVKWSRRAAEQGRKDSQIHLGIMYYKGQKGLPQDYAEAMKWFGKAAEQNCQYAQFKIGEMYYKGEGVSKDYSEAMKWYYKSAEQKYDIAIMIDAQFKLAKMYYRGEGAPRDYVRAYMWLVVILMKSRFDIKATNLRNEITPKMPTARIAEAQRLAEEWTESHAT